MPKLELQGAAELKREFAQWANVDAQKPTIAAARIIERKAKRLAPRLTGRLMRSIKTRLFRNRTRGVVIAEVGPGPEVEYAVFVERREPFMAPAADSSQMEIERLYLKAIDDALKGKYGRRV